MVGVVAVVGFNWFDGLTVCVYVCGFVDALMVCVCVCVWLCVCVMGLDRLIGVSWVCVWLCVLNRC